MFFFFFFRVSIKNVFHTVIRAVIYPWQRMKGFVVVIVLFFLPSSVSDNYKTGLVVQNA